MKKVSSGNDHSALPSPGAPQAATERYRSLFLAALTGACCNPNLLGSHHEEIAARAAERALAGNLDLPPDLRAGKVVVSEVLTID